MPVQGVLDVFSNTGSCVLPGVAVAGKPVAMLAKCGAPVWMLQQVNQGRSQFVNLPILNQIAALTWYDQIRGGTQIQGNNREPMHKCLDKDNAKWLAPGGQAKDGGLLIMGMKLLF
jgi:hypothetical protein